jgi:phosphatidate cytidylyltransferase
MKTRIIVAVISVPLLFVILFFLPPVAVTVVVAVIAAVASYELLKAVGACTVKRLCVYAAAAAILIPVGVFLGPGDLIFRIVLILLMSLLFGDGVMSYKPDKKITLPKLAAALFGGALIPWMLSAIVSLKLLDNGRFYVLIPFIIAFVTDGGAFFTGVFFGKHHPFPLVSPKKTTEGCVGGIMTCVAAVVVFGVVLHYTASCKVDFFAMAAYGLVGGIITELGDLAFSLIKREYGIKDYGSLLPGHGGMLDRFDSMIFAAPVLYLLVRIFPAF